MNTIQMHNLTIEQTHPRSRAYGYGNRTVNRCACCGEVLSDMDPGNGAGFRWAGCLARNAMTGHADKSPACAGPKTSEQVAALRAAADAAKKAAVLAKLDEAIARRQAYRARQESRRRAMARQLRLF